MIAIVGALATVFAIIPAREAGRRGGGGLRLGREAAL